MRLADERTRLIERATVAVYELRATRGETWRDAIDYLYGTKPTTDVLKDNDDPLVREALSGIRIELRRSL
jgi:hypothetical protein